MELTRTQTAARMTKSLGISPGSRTLLGRWKKVKASTCPHVSTVHAASFTKQRLNCVSGISLGPSSSYVQVLLRMLSFDIRVSSGMFLAGSDITESKEGVQLNVTFTRKFLTGIGEEDLHRRQGHVQGKQWQWKGEQGREATLLAARLQRRRDLPADDQQARKIEEGQICAGSQRGRHGRARPQAGEGRHTIT